MTPQRGAIPIPVLRSSGAGRRRMRSWQSNSGRRRWWRLFAAVNSPRLRFPGGVSLSGCHLLVSGLLFIARVSHAREALAFELAEAHALLGVGEVEVEDGPDEGEAAGLAGEAADDLGA